ncbi:MAG: hypothetical protein ACLFS2_09455, partial [Halochromatium sp.]
DDLKGIINMGVKDGLRIRRRLGWSDSEPVIRTKPRGMHRRTYERLVAQHERLADEAVLGLVVIPHERLCARSVCR